MENHYSLGNGEIGKRGEERANNGSGEVAERQASSLTKLKCTHWAIGYISEWKSAEALVMGKLVGGGDKKGAVMRSDKQVN